MRLETFSTDSTASYDRQLWAELCSLRILDDTRRALILGPAVINGLVPGRARPCRSCRCSDRCNVGSGFADAGTPPGQLSSQRSWTETLG